MANKDSTGLYSGFELLSLFLIVFYFGFGLVWFWHSLVWIGLVGWLVGSFVRLFCFVSLLTQNMYTRNFINLVRFVTMMFSVSAAEEITNSHISK